MLRLPAATGPSLWRLDALLIALGTGAMLTTIAVTSAWAHDQGEWLTRNTVRVSLAWYALALVLMMRLEPADWRVETPRGRVARWCWTLAIGSFLVHLAVAFHYYDHWSHAHAVERTRQVSGWGEGIYVSHLFTLLWVADGLWWWLRPAAYARRPIIVDRALHTFILLIVFNGMVVYETGLIRYAGLALFALLALRWCQARGWPWQRMRA